MNKDLNEVFFHEFEGVEARFRDHDFHLTQEDIKVIEDYVSSVATAAKENGEVDTNSFKTLMNVVEVLERSPEEECELLLERIYSKIAQIGLK